MGSIISIVISCVVFFLVITLLPYLIWFFIIFAIIAAVFNVFRNIKIRKMNEQYYRDFNQENSTNNNSYTYQNQGKTNVDNDVIDVEFTEHVDE